MVLWIGFFISPLSNYMRSLSYHMQNERVAHHEVWVSLVSLNLIALGMAKIQWSF